jgi:hypothetical protein
MLHLPSFDLPCAAHGGKQHPGEAADSDPAIPQRRQSRAGNRKGRFRFLKKRGQPMLVPNRLSSPDERKLTNKNRFIEEPGEAVPVATW